MDWVNARPESNSKENDPLVSPVLDGKKKLVLSSVDHEDISTEDWSIKIFSSINVAVDGRLASIAVVVVKNNANIIMTMMGAITEPREVNMWGSGMI